MRTGVLHAGVSDVLCCMQGIGLPLEEAMKFWRAEFGPKCAGEAFDKKYAYGVRYNYAKEGKRTDYTPYSCMKIIQTPVPKVRLRTAPAGIRWMWAVRIQKVLFSIALRSLWYTCGCEMQQELGGRPEGAQDVAGSSGAATSWASINVARPQQPPLHLHIFDDPSRSDTLLCLMHCDIRLGPRPPHAAHHSIWA